MPTAMLAKRVASAVRKSAGNKQSTWFTPFMAVASRAIFDRIPLVDFVLDVRDARVPLSSECEQLRRLSSSSRRIVVLNKVDLAKRSDVKFLNFLQGQVRGLKAEDPKRHTITMMLVGITNVGKSALANSLHKIGRISAAEKGKLRHAAVSPVPGETKSINSLKVASHPNIYILDTPGILPPQISDDDICAKLALIGALNDSLAGEKALTRYFLSVLNLSDEYQKWEKLSTDEIPTLEEDQMTACVGSLDINRTVKEEISTDHTKDSVVQNVRRSLFKAISSFAGNIEDEEDMLRLVETQLRALKEVFNVGLVMPNEDADHIVAVKLLNLYRTGRLGRFILDSLPVT